MKLVHTRMLNIDVLSPIRMVGMSSTCKSQTCNINCEKCSFSVFNNSNICNAFSYNQIRFTGQLIQDLFK